MAVCPGAGFSGEQIIFPARVQEDNKDLLQRLSQAPAHAELGSTQSRQCLQWCTYSWCRRKSKSERPWKDGTGRGGGRDNGLGSLLPTVLISPLLAAQVNKFHRQKAKRQSEILEYFEQNFFSEYHLLFFSYKNVIPIIIILGRCKKKISLFSIAGSKQQP